ncbi:hypothetical protein [Pelagibacterium xiamenense]
MRVAVGTHQYPQVNPVATHLGGEITNDGETGDNPEFLVLRVRSVK